MGRGIAIVGANGSGKTTMGRRLAEQIGYKHLDIEDYYFDDSPIPYAKPRAKDAACALLLSDIERCDHFTLSAVNGDLGSDISSQYDFVVYLNAPLDIRLERIKQRTLERFGSRVLKGGDMYEQERRFIDFVAARTMDATDAWLKTMSCPVLHLDTVKPLDENIQIIKTMVIHWIAPPNQCGNADVRR